MEKASMPKLLGLVIATALLGAVAFKTSKKGKKTPQQAPEAVSEPRKAADEERRNVMAEMGRAGAKKRWKAARERKEAEKAQPAQVSAEDAASASIPS